MRTEAQYAPFLVSLASRKLTLGEALKMCANEARSNRSSPASVFGRVRWLPLSRFHRAHIDLLEGGAVILEGRFNDSLMEFDITKKLSL